MKTLRVFDRLERVQDGEAEGSLRRAEASLRPLSDRHVPPFLLPRPILPIFHYQHALCDIYNAQLSSFALRDLNSRLFRKYISYGFTIILLPLLKICRQSRHVAPSLSCSKDTCKGFHNLNIENLSISVRMLNPFAVDIHDSPSIVYIFLLLL